MSCIYEPSNTKGVGGRIEESRRTYHLVLLRGKNRPCPEEKSGSESIYNKHLLPDNVHCPCSVQFILFPPSRSFSICRSRVDIRISFCGVGKPSPNPRPKIPHHQSLADKKIHPPNIISRQQQLLSQQPARCWAGQAYDGLQRQRL